MTQTATRPASPTVGLLGVPVSVLSMDATVTLLSRMLESDTAHVVVTADSAGFVTAQEDADLARIYRSADLATPDSQGVVWALKRIGASVSRVSGIDLAEQLVKLSAEQGHRVYLLGAAPGVAELAAEKLRLRYPGCNIVGTRHGYFPPDDDDLVAAEVAAAKPDVLLVAMGIPRQEKFISRTRETVRAKVAMGVGGSFDVFAGRAKRALLVVQKLRLEWLWRLLLNPSKFQKVRLLPKFVILVLREGR